LIWSFVLTLFLLTLLTDFKLRVRDIGYGCHVEATALRPVLPMPWLNNGKRLQAAAARDTNASLLNCFVVAAAAVDSTPVNMITIVRPHQHQLTSSPMSVTNTPSRSTHKQISSFSSTLSLSYFGQASILSSFLLIVLLMHH